jgi:oligoribonuclease NrnB/cAMP/cGMP phosphodiesterase (DHH superfamily)
MINRKISNQEIYKRALCDSDFDGCICAAILKEVFPDIELHFADPGSIQSGRYGQWVNADTIIADLPYIEGCGLYFDHHLGNKPGHEINGSWQLTPCAAEIVLEYFKQSLDVTKYKELVARLADFDSGNVNLADIKDPDIYMQLGFAIDRKDKDFQVFFATFLATHSWE